MAEDRKCDFFKFGKIMLTLWGLWPRQDLCPLARVIYKIYGIMILFTTIIPYNICAMIDLNNRLQTGQWMETLPTLSVSLAMVLGCFKVAVYIFNFSKIRMHMNAFDKEAFEYRRSQHLNSNKIIKRCIWLYNIQVSVCFGITGIMIMTNVDTAFRDPVISKLNESIPVLPFINWLPYDYSKSPIYEISFCMIDIWFYVSANIIIVIDSLCMGLMIYTFGQLKILRMALETLRSRAIEEIKMNRKAQIEAQTITKNKSICMEKLAEPPAWEINAKIAKMFRKCAEHHQAIISYAKGYEKILSTVIFLQFFISCLMVCFTILVVTNNNSLMSSRMTCLIILACSMWELTVYCYFGNEIIIESNNLSLSIYMSEWYLMDTSMMRNFSIMLTKTQKPIVFKAGGFVPLSLHTFLTVLKASYSYYAFLRNITNK